ncbi:PepSY-associated TM helix domain-containing protein [Niabella beijingensis]|uniref:PepSY-associated TM helix domain-containing protein n=1 Tax=Niabella beijingensis TaxID=2872700 RepID=UPI001CBF98BB|nr:PepSY-associated TM helix domain-containing protein [Niabella beijingensis]MBZ4188072.1 PepSY domain-containing protein [Niabella beijingensis]
MARTSDKKKKKRSLFYRVSAWLHLWLGLVTGLVMVVVCLCACIWVFNEEITGLLQPETKVARENKAVIPPSRLMRIADSLYPGKKAGYATYKQGNAIYLSLGEGRTGNTVLRIHPYTGAVISVKENKEGKTDFFRFILNGHRFLWLPPEIGRPIVNYSTLVFVLILISGIVLWWPRRWTKAARKQSFTIKAKASFKRVNYDLHNVLGFYALLVLAVMALTGMVYGIKWYSKGLYWVTSGGHHLPEFNRGRSDSLQAGRFYTPAAVMDQCWNKVAAAHPEAEGIYYSFADIKKPASAINITIYPTAGKYYNTRSFAFDQHTGEQLKGNNPIYDKSYTESSGAAKFRRMNYDLHVGSILGLPGKILAFFGALIGASLPVTGFLVWWGKRKKKPVAIKLPVAAKQLPAVMQEAALLN